MGVPQKRVGVLRTPLRYGFFAQKQKEQVFAKP
jgi:hypothetical protein